MLLRKSLGIEAYALIEKLEAEQNALYSYQNYLENSKTKKSRIPPPPILLARTHCSVTLKPAPFISDVKIPADGKSIFEIKGLETNEKYIFAIAAYSSNGKLIGDAVGETTKPILIYPPLSAVTARMYLTQVAYQIGNYELAKKVFSPVWGYFVASPPQDDQSVVSLSNIMMVTQKRMQSNILADTSSILLYLFLRNIFVMSDIKIKEENLFCDNIKGNEIFPAQQMARLRECENVLVALELSNFLNDSNYALQAVTQCYGLLAPIIYHNIVLVPVIQGTCYKKTSRSKKPQQVLLPEKINEQLNFLETHLLKLTKQYGSAELSGAEDPIFLYPVVLNWSMKGAMKEVMKFKQRPRFLEFFTQVMLKCMNDEKFQLMVEMVAPIYDFLKRRNESLIGAKRLRCRENTFSKKIPKSPKKYKAIVIEIGRVLAYRGGYWTLLQNCCRAFWNFAQELQILLKQAVDTYKAFPINQDSFLCACVLPFSLGTELLIDMLIKLQSTNSVKPVEDKGDFSVPSCYGNIKSDNGGSSLIFEHPLDDINVVDLKWIHDYVLKSLEILYQVEKWETLVSLAIQFNTISHERYTEQVTPLLVYAQRQLLTRIQKFNGPDIAQQACARYEADNGQKITCRNFIGKQLMIDPSSPRTLPDAEGCSDLLKMLILSEHQRAKQLVCVPVDVEDTLRCFRETLEKSKYHNRSVRHTKKLLLLFLAQTQGEKGGISNMQFSSGKVEFCLGTEEMHMSTPPDLSQENFRVFSSVEKSKLPYSQLGLSLLRTTLLHPKAEHSYAQYEITQLLPGIELFTDQFRADICSVIASLYYVIRELHYAKYNLIAEILIDLGFFSEASYEIFQIFHGKNLPSTIPAGYKTIAKVKVLEDLVNKGLPLILVTLGHQHLLNKYNFVKAHFFISLAATINCIPDSSSKTLFYTVAVDKNKPNTPNFKDLYPKDNENVHAQSLRLRDESTLCMMKSLLLTEAEEKINSLLSDMDLQCHKPLCQCSAQELEILVEARLQLAAIALQRQRAPYGTHALESEEPMEGAPLSSSMTTENKDDSEFLDPISLNAREYFNIHLWLKCRLMLVTAFIAQIRGIGIMKENDMTDCLSLINEVCMEAKSADDMEILAELLMQAVILGLQEKHLKADIIGNLQMLTFGETIKFPLSDADFANPQQPLKNIYLPHVILLAKVKLRIGHTLSKQVYSQNKKKDITKWLPSLHIFEMALKLCKVAALEECEVEAEILFQKENYQVSFQTGSPFLQQNDEIYDSVDPKRKANNKVDITWILLIRYFIHLQRINNMSKLLASATPVSGISLPDDMLLTSLYNSELILRQKEMHLFLKKFLQFYSSSCIDEFPKELIQGVEKSVSLEKFLFETSGKVHRENSLQSDISGKLFCSPSYTEAFSEMAVQAVNKELCFQWYIPPLDKPPKDTEPMVLLLYAYNLKPLKISDIKVPTANNLYVGTSWIPLNRQVDAILRKPDGDDNG
ncbi:cilia and flagella associated protein 54 [Cricetulus griseus]